VTIQIVPTTGSVSSNGQVAPNAFWTQTTTLEGVTFYLTFSYNQRCQVWYLSIADAENVDIYNGMKLVCGVPLLVNCADPRQPAGVLVVVSSTADSSPPGLNDLLPGSGRCALFYVTSDWVALLEAGELDTILSQLAAQTQTGTASTYGSS
jgi:hypothetical protein